MQTVHDPGDPVGSGSQGKDRTQVLLDDEDFFELFVDEAMRRGVCLDQQEEYVALLSEIQDGVGTRSRSADISDMVQVALDMVKYRETQQVVQPRAAVRIPEPRKEPISEPIDSPADRMLRKLGWSPNDPSTRARLESLVSRIRDAGISDPESHLTLREAGLRAGVAERTLRRYISEGILPTEKVQGPRGPEHRVYAPLLFLVLQERSGAFERARSSPMDDMGREIASLCRVIVEQQTTADRRTDRLLDEIRQQTRIIDELRAEQRDARAQMYNLQEQMIKALMPRPKTGVFQRMFSRGA